MTRWLAILRRYGHASNKMNLQCNVGHAGRS
jgi:hypothetical protein